MREVKGSKIQHRETKEGQERGRTQKRRAVGGENRGGRSGGEKEKKYLIKRKPVRKIKATEKKRKRNDQNYRVLINFQVYGQN